MASHVVLGSGFLHGFAGRRSSEGPTQMAGPHILNTKSGNLAHRPRVGYLPPNNYTLTLAV